MTQKHFIRIAAILKHQLDEAKTPAAKRAVRWTARDLAVYFREINPNFSHSRFLTACGI